MNVNEFVKNVSIIRKNVVIIGSPASGKTYLADQLKNKYKYHKYISTDDYKEHGFKEALYKVIKDIENTKSRWVVEGVLGYRLIRKGVEQANPDIIPDLIIILNTSEENIKKVYDIRGKSDKLEKVMSMIKSNDKVFQDYLKKASDVHTMIYRIENEFKPKKPRRSRISR